jgi:hypothetical protein
LSSLLFLLLPFSSPILVSFFGLAFSPLEGLTFSGVQNDPEFHQVPMVSAAPLGSPKAGENGPSAGQGNLGNRGGPLKGKIPRTVRPAGEPGGRASGQAPAANLGDRPARPRPPPLVSSTRGGGARARAGRRGLAAAPPPPGLQACLSAFFYAPRRRSPGAGKKREAQRAQGVPPYWPAGELGRGPSGPGQLACRPFFTPRGGVVAGRSPCTWARRGGRQRLVAGAWALGGCGPLGLGGPRGAAPISTGS